MTLLRKRPGGPSVAPSPLSLSAAAPTATQVGVAYSQTNTALGGTAPYTFAIVAGTPPNGVTLKTTGIVSGTPVNPGGAFSYTVRVTDNVGATAFAVTSGVVSSTTLTLTSGAASVAQVAAPYSQTNLGNGGVAPYVYTKSAGTLPTGTTLSSSTGTVSGTVGGVAGSFSYTITVTDNVGATASNVIAGTILAASSTIVPTSLAQVDVQNAINSAHTGDTVMLPAGTAIWDTSVLVSDTAMHVVGAGMEDGGTRIIHDGGNHSLFSAYTISATGLIECCGIHFDGQGTAYNPGGAFILSGAKNNNMLLHHCHFENFGNWVGKIFTVTGAVFANNRITGNKKSGIMLYGKADPNTPATLVSTEFDEPMNFGTLAVGAYTQSFIEDNEIDLDTDDGAHPTQDLTNGGRIVYRYNTITNGFFQTHDKARNGECGGAYWEVYNNSFVSLSPSALWWKAIDLASGTGRVYNNSLTGPWDAGIGVIDTRSDEWRLSYSFCDGTSAVDRNDPGTHGYMCEQQVGSRQSMAGAGIVSAPVYAWNNTLNGVTKLIRVTETQPFYTTLHLIEGRDFFSNTQLTALTTPAYTAFAYPHPLRASGTAYGQTYFVDITAGNDSNSGKTSVLPWKYCPGMAGWTGSATLSPGDKVYFKVTGNWSVSGSQGIWLTGGVAYIGDKWGGNLLPGVMQRATLTSSGTHTDGVVRFRDHATYQTTFQGFDVNANNKVHNGLEMNHSHAAYTLTGALKTVRNCIIRNVSSSQALGQFQYGLIISNHSSDGTSAEVSNVLVEKTVVHDISRDGLCLYPGDESGLDIVRNITVRQCEVYNCGQDPDYTRGSGIVVKGRVIDSTIENCYVHDITKGSGIFVNSNETNHYGSGANNVHIRNNIIVGNITQGSIRVYDGGGADARDLHIYGNICHSNTTGPGLYIGDQLLGANSLRVYNNTFYNAPVSVSGAGGATFPVFEFKNNIVVQTNATVPLISTSAFTAHNNNLFRSAGTTLVNQGGTFTAATLTGWEATALSSDPAFKNSASLPAGFNGIYGLVGTNTATVFIMKPNTDGLSLNAGSPAINSGATLASPYTMSINSVTRTTFDRGAWEV